MARKSKQRYLPKTIRLICEGETEYQYFNDLKKEEGFNFKIKPELPKHSSSIKGFEKKIASAINFDVDMIFCIIDLDRILANPNEKEKYDKLKQKYTKHKNVNFESVPCFEFWFLLHFVYTNRCFENCKEVVRMLDKPDYLEGYNKSIEYHAKMNFYTFLKNKIPKAIERAKKAEIIRNQHSGNNDYPKSDVYRIIEQMNIISREK